MVWNTHQYWSIFTQEHFLSWSLLAELPWLVKVALISWNEWLHTGLYREFHSNNTKAVKYDLVAPVQFLFDCSPNPISDENNRQKLQTKISDENLRRKFEMKIGDENLKQYLSAKFVTKTISWQNSVCWGWRFSSTTKIFVQRRFCASALCATLEVTIDDYQ